jgi:protoporphyrinogen oxidase
MQRTTVAVVGGGIIGIAAALKLAGRPGFDITLFEKQERLGGLDSWYEWEDLACDRFYHVVLPADAATLRLVDELGLGPELYWRRVRSGFYGNGRLVPLSTVRDFLRFPFLSFWQRVRLGLGIVYSSQVKKISGLDGVSASGWLKRTFGAGIYDRVWEPLLRSKLGDAADRTSAAFMGATIRRLYGARRSHAKQEKMGYWRGGFRALLGAAEARLRERGVTIRTGEPVLRVGVTAAKDGRPGPDAAASAVEVTTRVRRETHGSVLLTVPCPEAVRLTAGEKAHPYWRRLDSIEYLGIACVLLVLRRSASPYYVINLLDRGLPFTGIIETTNIIPPEDLGGRSLIYLPKYVTARDSLNDLSDEGLADLFTGRFREIFPDIRESDILHRRVFREPYAQPIPALHSIENPIGSRTPIPCVYLANTAMIPDTLHNDASIKLAGEIAASIPGSSGN